MKYPFFLLLLFYSMQVSGQEIQWHNDLEKAIQSSKENGRPVLIDFWADWCEPCKTMEAQLWKSRATQPFTTKFTFVRLNFDQASAVIRKYHIVTIPTVVFTDSWGNYLTRVSGFNGSAPYLQVMRIVPANYKPLDAWNEVLAKDGKNMEALRSIARFYYDAGAYEFSNHFYDRALGQSRTPAEKSAILLSVGWNYLKLKDYPNAEEIFSSCLKEKELTSRDVALFGIVVSSLGQNKRKEAEKALELLNREYPESQATAQARRLLQNQ